MVGAINLMQEGLFKLSYQTLLLLSLVYSPSFAAAVLQINRLYELVF